MLAIPTFNLFPNRTKRNQRQLKKAERRKRRKRAVVRQLIGEQLETRRVLATLSITGDNVVRDEGDSGFTNFTFTVTRGGVTTGVSTVNYSVSGSGANPADVNDFNGNLLPTGNVGFGSGQTSKTITIVVRGDRDLESDETFAVMLSNPSFGDTISAASATGTIRNDDLPDAPSLSIEAANATRDEGDAGPTAFTFTVTRSGNLNTATTVDYTVTGSGDTPADVNDFNSNILPTGTVAFGSGQASRTITINVDGDLDFEPDESFAVTLFNPSGGATIDTASATGTISNDELPPVPSLSIATANSVRDEGDTGTTQLTFTVTRSGNLANATTVDFTVSGSGASPADINDFNGSVLPAGTVGFASGQASRTITINVSGDRDLEADETFTVTLSNPSGGATISDATAIGTIRNDDVGSIPSLAIVAANAVRDEGDTGATPFTFRITRSGQTSVATSVNYVVSGGQNNPADVNDFSGNTFPTGTVNFAVGVTSQTITINVTGDRDFENDESFLVTLNSPSGNAVITEDTAAGTIINDEVEDSSQLAIAATDSIRLEQDNGSTPFTFTVTRSGSSSGAVTVDYAVNGGGTNPASASDFAGSVLPSGTVNFADGVTSQVITINGAGDFDAEEDESFTVTLSNATGGATITTAVASGTIQNDDSVTTPVAELAIAETDADRIEGDVGSTAFTFTVTRSVVTTEATTVAYNVTGSGENPASASDFTGNVLPTGTVSFAVGETSKIITVNVAGDRDEEFDESFLVMLSNASNQAIVTTATANGLIQNDDETVGERPRLTIAPDEANRDEGDSGATPFTFTVTRSGLLTGATSVDYVVTGSGTNPATNSDFAGSTMPSGVIDFAAGETLKTITINVIGDTVDEENEAFIVTLRNATDQATITTATAFGTIRNDDDVTTPVSQLAISATQPTIAEGDSGSRAITYMVTRSGSTELDVSVNYSVLGSGTSPASSNDFVGGTLPAGTLRFAPGETLKTISVNVADDTNVEDDETFIVRLSDPTTGAILTNSTATGTILNDDLTEINPVIITPSQIAGEQVIPASNSPTAILFEAVRNTTTSISLEGTPSSIETAVVVDRNGTQVSSFAGGVSTANLIAGEVYAIFFQPQSQPRTYSITSSAGSDALSSNPPSNILQPTDVNASGDTTATDALQIINELNRRDGFQGEPATTVNPSSRFLDVNADGNITALDALIVINFINEPDAIGTGEAEDDIAFSILQHASVNDQVQPSAREEQAIDELFASDRATLSWTSVDDSPRTAMRDVDSMMRASDVDAAFNDREIDSLERDLNEPLEQDLSFVFSRNSLRS